MIITSQIDMDFQQQKAPQEIKAVQYDANTRRVAISCYDNGEPADLSEVSHTVVHSRNADGTVSLYDTTQAGEQAVSIAGNVVTVVLDPSICAAPGKASVVVTLLNDQHDQLGIFPFAVQVSPCPVDYGETASGNYFNLLNQTITDLYDGVQALVDQNAAQIDRLQELGGITDVKLAGASIVSNLVATIPEATSETDGFMAAEQVSVLEAHTETILELTAGLSAVESAVDSAITDITLGSSTTPLQKTDGVVTIPAATSETDGFMTAADKAKLNDLEASAVTDITLGSSTTPLPKTDGVVNVPKSVVTSGGMKFTRIGNLVIMGGGTWGEVASAAVPAGYRPVEKQYCLVGYATAEWKPYVGRMLINTNGSIDMHSLDGTWVAKTDGYFIGSCAWLAE